MEKNIKVISQHIDTLKTHYYIDKKIDDEDYNKYTTTIKKLLSLKKESQELNNTYGDTKTINYFLGKHKFNVMPTSIKGFSVLLQNSDCSIALRQSKNKINPSPSIKIEFRAEFLARKGYIEAIKIINLLVTEHLLSDFHIKISELHLATDIQGYDFTHLDFFKMKTRSRKCTTYEDESIEAKSSAYGGITTFTGFTYGGGDYHLRVYNKTKEITQFKSKSFAKHHLWDYNSNYDEDKTVWRIEFQIRRSKLKKIVLDDNTSLDDYYNVLNNIPSLWKRALTDFNMKNFTEQQTFDLLRGKRTLKSGVDKPLTKYAIYKIFSRTETLPFWDEIKTWNTHEGKVLNNAPKIPKNGNFLYIENSIKSLYSTMAKFYGSTNADALIDSFKQANLNSIEKNQMSLLESTYHKQLDWIENIDEMNRSGLCGTPDYKDLEREIFSVVTKASEFVKLSPFTEKIVNRIESRHTFDEDIKIKDLNYLNNLVMETEVRGVF